VFLLQVGLQALDTVESDGLTEPLGVCEVRTATVVRWYYRCTAQCCDYQLIAQQLSSFFFFFSQSLLFSSCAAYGARSRPRKALVLYGMVSDSQRHSKPPFSGVSFQTPPKKRKKQKRKERPDRQCIGTYIHTPMKRSTSDLNLDLKIRLSIRFCFPFHRSSLTFLLLPLPFLRIAT